MDNRKGCEAIQQSDQKVCNRCGLVWDMNDPDPPPCKTDAELSHERGLKKLYQIKERYFRK